MGGEVVVKRYSLNSLSRYIFGKGSHKAEEMMVHECGAIFLVMFTSPENCLRPVLWHVVTGSCLPLRKKKSHKDTHSLRTPLPNLNNPCSCCPIANTLPSANQRQTCCCWFVLYLISHMEILLEHIGGMRCMRLQTFVALRLSGMSA